MTTFILKWLKYRGILNELPVTPPRFVSLWTHAFSLNHDIVLGFQLWLTTFCLALFLTYLLPCELHHFYWSHIYLRWDLFFSFLSSTCLLHASFHFWSPICLTCAVFILFLVFPSIWVALLLHFLNLPILSSIGHASRDKFCIQNIMEFNWRE